MCQNYVIFNIQRRLTFQTKMCRPRNKPEQLESWSIFFPERLSMENAIGVRRMLTGQPAHAWFKHGAEGFHKLSTTRDQQLNMIGKTESHRPTPGNPES